MVVGRFFLEQRKASAVKEVSSVKTMALSCFFLVRLLKKFFSV